MNRGRRRALLALLVAALALVGAAGGATPVYDGRVPAQSYDLTAPTNDQAFVWARSTSTSLPSSRVYHATANDERVLDFKTYPEAWLLIRYVQPAQADWPPVRSGIASIVNLHNVPFDAGNAGRGGIGWGWGSGVSPVHFGLGGRDEAYPPEQGVPLPFDFAHVLLVNHTQKGRELNDFGLPRGIPGEWFTALVRVEGDYAQAGTGELDVWVSRRAGERLAKAVEKRNLRILLRAVATSTTANSPKDGRTYVQRFAWLWDVGPYVLQSTRANRGPHVWLKRHAITHAGPTLEKALADEPTVTGIWGSYHKPGFEPNLGDFAATRVAVDPPAPVLPFELGGTNPPPVDPLPELEADAKAALRALIRGRRDAAWSWPRVKRTEVWAAFVELGGR